MKRLERAAVLLSLVENLKIKGSWCGETHVQKATYFLQELTEVPLGFDFILYKHGPFSFDLSDEIIAMRADALLKLQSQPYPYGPSLIPGEGSGLVGELFQKTVEKYANQVEFISEKLGDKRVAELERLATALYVSNEMDESLDSRAHRISEIKPHISLEEARAAVQSVDALIEESERVLNCKPV